MFRGDDVDVAQLRRMIKIGGYARATFGVAMVVAPGLVADGWIGADGKRGGVKALTRALGIRDLLLGAGAILAANEGRELRRWVEFGMVADATDALATLLATRSIPARKAALAFLVAGGAAGAGGWILSRLPEEVPSTA